MQTETHLPCVKGGFHTCLVYYGHWWRWYKVYSYHNNHDLNKKKDPQDKIWHIWPFGFIILLPQINNKYTTLAWLVHQSHSADSVLKPGALQPKKHTQPNTGPFFRHYQRLHLLPESLTSITASISMLLITLLWQSATLPGCSCVAKVKTNGTTVG